MDNLALTDDQLRAAWHELADPTWGSFDDARLAALHMARVRLKASLSLRGVRTTETVQQALPPVAAPAQPPSERAAPSTWRPRPLEQLPDGQLDRKRLAAGERQGD